MKREVEKILASLTLEEKACLTSGFDSWHTFPVPRLGILPVMMCDGPHGLRKQKEGATLLDDEEDIPATCFPTGASLACSWDRKLIGEVAEAIAQECKAQQVGILLGPAINIKRSPLCGRNFEYLSEDPYLAGQLAVSYVQASQRFGVGVSVKHFAANNQETGRNTGNSVVDERTLREIYLAAFEQTVKQASPWTMMCSYNQLNGTYCSENGYLLTKVLRDEWGFQGAVMSDWGAVNEREKGIAAGLDLEMPTSGNIGPTRIIDAVKRGDLSEKALDRCVINMLELIFKVQDKIDNTIIADYKKNNELAARAAAQCMVLMKNDGILPLKNRKKIAVLGALAKSPRYEGGGSSHVNPYMSENIFDRLRAAAPETSFFYADGYDLHDGARVDEALLAQAVKYAGQSDVCLVFAGLTEEYESEGWDRKDMKMPPSHIALIEAVSGANSDTVVLLSNGSPVEMDWAGHVKGILDMYLPGQAPGTALADILFGKISPSGKLAESVPYRLEDNPSYFNFPGDYDKTVYGEGLLVGYRHYQTRKIPVRYPFGYGLSYTSFCYSDLQVSEKAINDTDSLRVSLSVENTGKYDGSEIIQLYVHDEHSSVVRPVMELKGFEKIFLKKGERKSVSFLLDKRAFAFYDVNIGDWVAESGRFQILIGASCEDIRLSTGITVTNTTGYRRLTGIGWNTTLGAVLDNPHTAKAFQEMGAELGLFEKGAGKQELEAKTGIMRDIPLRAVIPFIFGKSADCRAAAEIVAALNRALTSGK